MGTASARRARMRIVCPAVVYFALCLCSARLTAQTRDAVPDRLILDKAITEALANNLDLIATRIGISVAEAGLIAASIRPNPVVSVGGDHLDVLGTGFNLTNGGGPTEYSARVDFLVERGAKRARRIDVAREDRAIAEAQLLDAVRTLQLDVQQAFVDMQLAQENLALARENAAALAEIVRLNTTRVESGDLADVELLRSRVATLQAEQAVRRAELRLRTERQRVERAIGRVPGMSAFEIEPLTRPAPITDDATVLRARAVASRPDLRALRAIQARSLAEIRLQLAQRQVDFTVGTEYRRQTITGHSNSLGVFFSAPLPVFDRNQGNIARARQEDRQADLRVQRLEQVVTGDVDLAAAQYASADVSLRTVETDMLTQARDVRDITDYAYRRGEASLIEFLDAQRAFNETMQTWNEARAEYARSVFLVRAAVGENAAP